MGTSPEIQQFSIDDIFGDVNLQLAEKLYKEYRANPKGLLADIFLKEVIEDSIDLINHRTGQENDSEHMAYVLEWACRGWDLAMRLEEEPESISPEEVIDFVHLDHAINNPHAQTDYEVLISTWTGDMYKEAFLLALEPFGG